MYLEEIVEDVQLENDKFECKSILNWEVFTEEKSWEKLTTCPELFQNEEMN